MSEESDALLHIADDHPCCKPTLLWAHNRLLELERENAALREALEDLCSVADSAMREANRHTAYSWEIEKELEPAMRALSQNQNP